MRVRGERNGVCLSNTVAIVFGLLRVVLICKTFCSKV